MCIVFASLFRVQFPNSRFGALLDPTNLAPVNFILFKSFTLPLYVQTEAQDAHDTHAEILL